jgi:lipoprotein-anchoring transpeptidase ErfK/SrfK
MKRHSRTAFLLTTILAATTLDWPFAYRGRNTDSSIERDNQAGQVSAAELDDSGNHPSVPSSPSIPMTPAHFEVFNVRNGKSVTGLESRLGAETFTAMLKINRTDKKHIRAGDSLVIPDPGSDLMQISPFPLQLEVAQAIPKLILVSRRVQAFGAYESGRLVRWGPTSTGKKSTPTPAGLYHTNWKAKETRSSVNQDWILPWCFNLDNFSGISFHKFDLPGYPASHGCVRLLEEDAKWIYGWADQWMLSETDRGIIAFGTPVVIFGDYQYGEKPVWKRLVEDSTAAAISITETGDALNQHLTTIAVKAGARRAATARRQMPAGSVAIPNQAPGN